MIDPKTPLPWSLSVYGQGRFIRSAEHGHVALVYSPQDAAYAVHAANVLPEVVAALERIQQWSEAYPVDIFLPVDLKAVRAALDGAGISMDGLHAEWARHITSRVGDIARAALAKADGAAA